ncbi:lytic murein transglycosylase, partial [Pseudomonas aeruginosa]
AVGVSATRPARGTLAVIRRGGLTPADGRAGRKILEALKGAQP